MERVNKILKTDEFNTAMQGIKAAEQGRIYCLHGLEHLLDTARIAYIINLEESLGLKKDVIYATSILHDTGRAREYKDGTPHPIASKEIALAVLLKCGYTEVEINDILQAIDTHRGGKTKSALGNILRRADDLSRMCFACEARATCKWTADEMNFEIKY